ncbi:LysR family transcriptional regulator [Ideonella sp. DXS22W]|uniref:LysR family transcriptional regulator n=1 Tax=Pseudaquabacterium inlustre TaxID=2984192 RepID=A0ABU9CJ79_9BURK
MDERRIDTLWSHVHALSILGTLGSYTAAAQRLGLSKAAMSQRIAELERAAGVPLVLRTTRSVRLTEAGQRLADATAGAFDTIATAFSGVRDLAEQPRGRLRITAPVALARQQLVPRLPDFLRAHPEVRVELDLSDRLVPLAQEGFDLAIRHTHAPPETHVAWALCETRSLLVASRAYLRRRGTPATPDDLAAHDCLHYLRPGDTPTWTLGDEQGQERTVPVAGPFAANNSEALREAALRGLGIALLPDFSAQAALREGRLLPVLPGWRPVGNYGSHLWAIRPYSPYVPRAVQALVGWLREALAEGFAA